MLVLALDTATPAVTAGVLTVDDGIRTLAQRVTVDARAHGELLLPQVTEALGQAGVTMAELDAIVCGSGPGPFTGLRVGMVTAAALGHALDRPVYPVSSLDAIAADLAEAEPTLVVTDARRREVYAAAYDRTGHRIDGPQVIKPSVLAERLAELGVTRAAGQGAELYADILGLPVVGPPYPSPRGLAAVAAPALLAGAAPEQLTPLYLRRPDAVEPGARKKVAR